MSKSARDAVTPSPSVLRAMRRWLLWRSYLKACREVSGAAVRQVREDALPCVRRAALDACLTLAAGLPRTLEDDDESHTF